MACISKLKAKRLGRVPLKMMGTGPRTRQKRQGTAALQDASDKVRARRLRRSWSAAVPCRFFQPYRLAHNSKSYPAMEMEATGPDGLMRWSGLLLIEESINRRHQRKRQIFVLFCAFLRLCSG